MLGQSDVTKARVIDQALVVSSPWSGVIGSDAGTFGAFTIEAAKRTRFLDRSEIV